MLGWGTGAAHQLLRHHIGDLPGRARERDSSNSCLPGFQPWKGLRIHPKLLRGMPHSGRIWCRQVPHGHRRCQGDQVREHSHLQVRLCQVTVHNGQVLGQSGGGNGPTSSSNTGLTWLAQFRALFPGTTARSDVAKPASRPASAASTGDCYSDQNTGTFAAIPFTGASPMSWLPYNWSLYGQLPLLGPLPTQQGIDHLVDRPKMSYGDAALPLGGHLALAVKEKIWRGEFVDLYSLLHKEPEPVASWGTRPQTPRWAKKKEESIRTGIIGLQATSSTW